MTTKTIREQFEKATMYESLNESTRQLLDSTAWPTWCLAWSRMKSSIDVELREKVRGLLAISEAECYHLDSVGEGSSARVLRREITLMDDYLTSLDS
jgi:hypothetical protein